ncbi:hypothetical protein [Microbacterium sp. ProA8]|uniref:DUF7341 domain-containing protein n=1 Tax=Microbacterium chionoecetis TaxID=3153754 RepID=UPI003267C931
MTELTELLDAVDSLTKPGVLHHTIQDSRFTCVVFDTPLLDRLENEIRFSLSREGSKSLPNQRVPINSGALQLFMRISSQITDWAHGAKATVYKGDPGRTLRAWYVAWTQTEREPQNVTARVRLLAGWEASIRREIEPPRQKDLPDPCPTCGAVEWWRDGERYPRPLVVESPRNPDRSLIDESTAHCRACDKRWGARELAYELEQMPNHTDGSTP